MGWFNHHLTQRRGFQEAIQRVRLSLYVNGLSISGDIKRVGCLGGVRRGWGGRWKVQKWMVQKWMVEVDRPCNLGVFDEAFRNYDEKKKQQHEFFFGDMVTVDVWKKSMAKYMHQSL